MKRSLTRLFSVLALALLLGVAGFAQVSSTGSLSGSVADAHGAVVANATVTLKNMATNQEFTTQTNDNGNFNIPSVATGLYTATIVAPGFKKAEVSEIKIPASSRG